MKAFRAFGPAMGKVSCPKKFKEAGATILGDCCETRPSHIKEMAKLK